MHKIVRAYHFAQHEHKWQKVWSSAPITRSSNNKHYCLAMFPYPSGNLHLGHVRVYSISDAIARYELMQRKQVIYPMGWDSFGLPAENAAKERGLDPKVWTSDNIAQMRNQLNRLGYMFDWNREIFTHEPSYYRWTQYIFQILHRRGLAYQGLGYINWDPVENTVLANEQVDENGKGWRSGALVERRMMKQWFFKITDYAEELLKGLEGVNWPSAVVEMQRGWIGKSAGCNVKFRVGKIEISAFTTKVETIYGVKFLALSPEHSALEQLELTQQERHRIEELKKKSEVLRKSGNFALPLSKVHAIHPLTQEVLPVFVAEYVLMNYGTGCVMGVPAHDARDKLLAQSFNIPEVPVIHNKHLINSAQFTNLSENEGKKAILSELCKTSSGERKTFYRLRDWLVSRQRYWGTPIPIIHCDSCGPVPNPSLPVILPELSHRSDWEHTNCPHCHKPARREMDTLDTFVDSSWYYLRYLDPHNNSEICNKQVAEYSLPVDIYIGGLEHAIMHLLYARFIHKVLRDEGILKCDEPFSTLLTQGLVQGKTYKHLGKYITEEESIGKSDIEISYEKMSKSKKNGVSPSALVEEYGADVIRLALLFAAPSESTIEWQGKLLKTMQKWLESVWNLVKGEKNKNGILLDEFYKGITQSMERRKLHVVIARLMELTHILEENPSEKEIEMLVRMLHPFAPHFAAECGEMLGLGDVRKLDWPVLSFEIDINGENRGKVMVPMNRMNTDLKEYLQHSYKKLLQNLQIEQISIKEDKIYIKHST